MPYAVHEGVRIHYRIVGDGPPLILHHGFTQSLKRWYLCGYVEALSKDYKVIAMDPRGHGESDKPHDPAAYELTLRVKDVITVLDHLGIDRAAFWGYSNGGRIAFGLAKYWPERVSALIIGGHDPYERRIPEAARFDGKNAGSFLDILLLRLNMDASKMKPERRQELLANDFEALAAAQQDEPSIEDVLPSMTMPCFVYSGERDPFYPQVQRCVPLIPNVTFVTLPGYDHPAAFWNSGAIVPQVVSFLRAAGLPPESTDATADATTDAAPVETTASTAADATAPAGDR